MATLHHIQVETVGKSGRRISATIPAEIVNQTARHKMEHMKKNSRINGFRPGKVNEKTILKLYGSRIQAEVSEDLLRKSLNQALQEEKLQPATSPHVESLKKDSDGNLNYEVSFEVFPTIELKPLNDIKIEQWDVELTDQDIDDSLEFIRKQHSQWHESEQTSQLHDRLTLHAIAAKKGKKLADKWIILESTTQEIEAWLGLKAGDKSPIQPTPDHTWVIKFIEKPSLPILDENFIKKLGISSGDLADLKEGIRTQLSKEFDSRIYNFMRGQLVRKLIEAHPMEISPLILKEEYENLVKEYHQSKGEKISVKAKLPKLPDEVRNELWENAFRRIMLGLLLPTAVKEYNIELNENLVLERIQHFATKFEDPSYFYQKVMKDENTMQVIRAEVLERQIIEKLLESVQIEKKPISYKELMGVKPVTSDILNDSKNNASESLTMLEKDTTIPNEQD